LLASELSLIYSSEFITVSLSHTSSFTTVTTAVPHLFTSFMHTLNRHSFSGQQILYHDFLTRETTTKLQ